MEYLALYRKYRPKELEEVVGQTEIKQILASSIKNGTITHAYLFSGPRGTGKTTMAKIFAKMVNCENPVNGNACNECNSCLNVLQSSDVIEIDAASNNGVDEIRNLREKANLVPSFARYKVYIIDEVHMLTTQAFNALLKTLEEPPNHVIFILATTEYYKIPLTITSRCQKFQFNKINNEDIVDRLRKIADLEKIAIDDEALFEIAKISDGGMRDSINFLDQLRSYNSGKLTVNDVYNVCGNVSDEEIVNLVKFISNNDVEKITLFFENMDICGKNYGKFLIDFIAFLKDVILYEKNANSKFIKCDVNCVDSVAKMLSNDEIFYVISVINNIIDKLKFVSRQSVVIITNFLLIAYKINAECCAENIKKVVANDDKTDKDDFYDMAFQFTVSDSVKSDKSSVFNENRDVNQCNVFFAAEYKDKDIIINNTFAVANRDVKNNLQGLFSKVSDYLTDKKYQMVAGIFIDTKIQVAGDNYIIFSADYDAVVDKIYSNYKISLEFINKILNGDYNFVVITNSEWDKYREEYIKDIKSGKKYYLKPLTSNEIQSVISTNKESTIVDKLFELVGEDNVEIK